MTGETHPSVLRRVILNPATATPATILGLQAQFGNQAVQRLLANRTTTTTVQRGFLGDLKKNLKIAFATKKKKDVLKDMDDEGRLNALFADTAGRKFFSDYCKAEFSIENFNAYDFILKYKAAGQPFEMAQQFQNRFIGRNAEEELNIPSNVNVTFNKVMAESNPGNYLVKEVKDAVITNLLDTLSRFKTTPLYGQWLNSAYTG
ncbi:MAG: hypothetical protein J0I20_34225 [Chloroflexi bacterium]|nr:hypothetical protein [Chloroflexota bacterium]